MKKKSSEFYLRDSTHTPHPPTPTDTQPMSPKAQPPALEWGGEDDCNKITEIASCPVCVPWENSYLSFKTQFISHSFFVVFPNHLIPPLSLLLHFSRYGNFYSHPSLLNSTESLILSPFTPSFMVFGSGPLGCS